MEQMFVKDLLDATKGTLLCGKEDLPVERICINSKEAQVGDLFVPLIGEKVDAHRFLKMALEAGANVFVAGSAVYKQDAAANVKAFLKIFEEAENK